MSHPLIEHSKDLSRLRADGYVISVKHGYLVIDHVPFVTEQSKVVYGSLVSELTVQGNQTIKPDSHVVASTHMPHDHLGNKLTYLVLNESHNLSGDYATVCQFSNTPGKEPEDYYEKIKHYVDLVVPHAQAIDPSVTAKVNNPVDSSTYNVFRYIDSNTSRADTGKYAAKLMQQKIAIVGLGGSGSYILDLVAKTPVREIHLFDDDDFSNHNAFRSPGAASLDELDEGLSKVEYLFRHYDKMHSHITPHKIRIMEENIGDLDTSDFVFLCVDDAESRSIIGHELARHNIPFVDVGITVEAGELGLTGVSRVTLVHSENTAEALRSLPTNGSSDTLYSSNIQVADVNMLNAAQAVMVWKRWSGFYFNANSAHELVTSIDSGMSTIQ